MFHHFKDPVMITDGKMQYLYDETGRRYLDVRCLLAMHSSSCQIVHSHQAFAGIVTVSVGHCHPKVVNAVVEQSKRLQHTTTIYLNNQISEYAKELADRMPGNLKVRQHPRCCTPPLHVNMHVLLHHTITFLGGLFCQLWL